MESESSQESRIALRFFFFFYNSFILSYLLLFLLLLRILIRKKTWNLVLKYQFRHWNATGLVRCGPQRPPEFKTRSLNWLIHSFLCSIPPSSPTYYFTTTKQWRRFWGLVNQPDLIQLINSLTWAELHRMMTWTSADRWPFQLNAMNRRTGADEFNADANCKWDEVALSFDWLIVIIQVICSIE